MGDMMKIKVNEVELSYEIYGQGAPLILLHGNQEDAHIFDELIDALASDFLIYAIDSRNHGKSSKSIQVSYDMMVQDVYQFIRTLKINKPHLLGFSDGGIIGLKLAIYAPNLLDKLIVCGANYHPKGLVKHSRKALKREYREHKHPLIKLMINEPKIRKEELKSISNKTIIIAGEHDVIKLKHTNKMHQLINDSKLIILKDHTHDSYIIHSNLLKPYIIDHLKK